MKKTRHTKDQIAFALKQAQTGTSVAEVFRRMWISEQTFCHWKKVYGGLGKNSCTSSGFRDVARRINSDFVGVIREGQSFPKTRLFLGK